jgi:chitosanase
MDLTKTQRNLIERVINTVETGRPDGDYSAISIYSDGPNDIRQITYGRAQTTEYGNLRQLVDMYINAAGIYSDALKPYFEKIGSQSLTDNREFKLLLRQAGKSDPVMKKIQDKFFEKVYFSPAMKWADTNGFTKPLSALVIYDSQIHSGGILWLLRQQFSENPPVLGGSEKVWIGEYLRVRNKWLANHRRLAVRASIYRTKAYLAQVAKDNWDLDALPFRMNGTDVFPE